MTHARRPDGRAFSSWTHGVEDGDRFATGEEHAYLQERVSTLICPFCSRNGVQLVRAACVCGRSCLTLMCSDARFCRSVATVPTDLWTQLSSPMKAARALRRLWRSEAVVIHREHPPSSPPSPPSNPSSHGPTHS